MKYFAGLNVSLEETAICVVDEAGRIVKEARAASEPQALIIALRKVDLPLERIGLEACSLTAWLHDGMCVSGLPAICTETRQANAAMRTMPNKSDRNDARALAQIMRTGWYRQVHVKSRQCRLWQSLLVARRTVLNEMRTIENVARAILREAGIKLGTPSRTAFASRVRELAGTDPVVMPLVEPLLMILATMLREFGRLTDKAGPHYRPPGASLPATHERSGCGTHHRARLSCHDRSAGPLSSLKGCRRASGSDPGTLPIWRNGHSGQGEPMR